jgi:predicted O-methyltransferase YrrM
MKYNRSWFTYLRKAKGRHGIHSPFVFQLINSCLTTKVNKNFENLHKSYIKELYSDVKPFTINDLGVGSKRMLQTRSAKELAKNASSKGVYGDLLWKLIHFYKPKLSLELGTSVGLGTLTISEANKAGNVHTVEGCENTLRKAEIGFSKFKLNNIVTFNSDFENFLLLNSSLKYDFVFLDGNHSKSATLKYLELLKNKTHSETFFVFDDIRWSEDMWEMWLTIVNNEDFHVTLDFGRMGIALKRPQQVKEHFILRPFIRKSRFL